MREMRVYIDRGGLNLRSAVRHAVRHAPAAFLASISATQSLVEHILGCPPDPSPHIPPALLSLATEAARPDWQCLEDIDIPLRQRSFRNAMDESCFQQLLTSAPSSRFRALSLSSSLPHAGDWLNVVPSSSLGLHLYTTVSSAAACATGWGCLSTALHTPAQSAAALRIPTVTTKLDVVAMGTGLPATTPSEMSSSLWPSLQPWPPPRRPLA